MSIDLTKPIEIPDAWWLERIADGKGGIYAGSVFGCKGIPASDHEAYRQLFEQAPRTKLEHGKMLALLKRMATAEAGDLLKGDGLQPPYWWPAHDVWALIAEIEGGAA